MFYPTKYDWVATTRPANTAQPPPAHGESATLFASKLLLGAIGILAVIAIAAIAPTRVTFPLGVVLVAYALGTVVASIADRHTMAINPRRASGVRPSSSGERREHRKRDAAPRSPGAAWLGITLGSLGLLGAAFIVPADVGSRFAAAGLVGVVILRLAAIHDWAGRGLSRDSPRSLEQDSVRDGVSTERNPRGTRWRGRQPDLPPAYDRRPSATRRR